MKKFLKYQMELVETNENDLTDELVKKLNDDYKKEIGIYNNIFGGNVEIAVHSERNTLVLCGNIIADTNKECNSLYIALKMEAKKTFANCTKTNDMMVATGDRIR